MTRHATRDWAYWLLVLLTAEKIVQHTAVTIWFLTGWNAIRSTVVVDYRWLVVTGAALGVLFAAALAALWHDRRWSLSLLTALALTDVVGEFIAQGGLTTITVSFVVAILILILAQARAHTLSRGQSTS